MRTLPLLAAAVVASAISLLAAPAVAAPTSPRLGAAELAATQKALDSRLASPPDGITSWGADPATGRVTISVLAGDDAALSKAQAAKAGLVGASIVRVTERPRLLYNLVGGQVLYGPGSTRCSIGFSARSGSLVYALTAGHCTQGGGTWQGYNRVAIGPAFRTNFPTDDFASIRVSTPGWVGTSQVQGSSTVLGSSEAAIGASVCRSGSSTGYRCATIQAKNQTVNYGNGNVVSGLTKTNVCAEPGDSGGSFVSGRQAQGITSGGSGSCAGGSGAVATYFQPVNEVLSKYGLTLVTG